jgi:hypothetical protein
MTRSIRALVLIAALLAGAAGESLATATLARPVEVRQG